MIQQTPNFNRPRKTNSEYDFDTNFFSKNPSEKHEINSLQNAATDREQHNRTHDTYDMNANVSELQNFSVGLYKSTFHYSNGNECQLLFKAQAPA